LLEKYSKTKTFYDILHRSTHGLHLAANALYFAKNS